MGEQVEKVTLPFDVAGEHDLGSAHPTDGALALTLAEDARVDAAERVADYAQSWGITIPADITAVTKAQVAY